MQIFYTFVEGQRNFSSTWDKIHSTKRNRTPPQKKFHGVKWNVRIKKRKQQGQPYTLKKEKEKLHTSKDEVLGYLPIYFF